MADDIRRTLTELEYEAYYNGFLKAYLDWYGDEATRNEARLGRLQLCAMIATTLATIGAGIPAPWVGHWFKQQAHVNAALDDLKLAVFISSALATFFLTLITRYGFDDAYRKRETGRAEVTNMAQKARLELTLVPKTGPERAAYQCAIADAILAIEKLYGGPNQPHGG